jgi:hypothetical protein
VRWLFLPSNSPLDASGSASAHDRIVCVGVMLISSTGCNRPDGSSQCLKRSGSVRSGIPREGLTRTKGEREEQCRALRVHDGTRRTDDNRRAFVKLFARPGVVAKFPFSVHPHVLRHATGHKVANDGRDTRATALSWPRTSRYGLDHRPRGQALQEEQRPGGKALLHGGAALDEHVLPSSQAQPRNRLKEKNAPPMDGRREQ